MYDVVVLGSGPAGLTAAIYTQRFGLKTMVIAGRAWGGQLMLTTDVENYPGFSHIMGPELMKKMRDQVEALGVEIFDLDFTKIDTSASLSASTTRNPFVVTLEDGKTVEGKTVITATGAETRWLGVPGEEKLRGHGVSSCAPCDAFFFRGKPVAIVGGGDSAMEEAQVIAKVSPDVVLIHRRDEFRAQQAMIDKVTKMKNVRYLYNTQVVEMLGVDKLTGLLLQSASTTDEIIASFGGQRRDNNQWVLPREGVFVAIGLDPNTKNFTGLELDSHGYVKRYEQQGETGVIEYFTKTNVPGIFTAGDVHDARYKQAVTAAAFGCMAALDVQRWLAMKG